MLPVFLKGKNGNLKLSDLYDCPQIDSSKRVGEILEREWDKELRKWQKGGEPNLIKAVLRTFGFKICLTASLPVIEFCFFRAFPSFLLGYLLEHIAGTNVLSNEDLYMCLAGFCLVTALCPFVQHGYIFHAHHVAMRLRVACSKLIYRKSLKLSQAALITTTFGQMINLISNDVNKFDMSLDYIPYLVAAPLQVLVTIWIIWKYVGYSSLVLLAAVISYFPVQACIGKLHSKLRKKAVILTDERLGLLNEIIGGMKLVKMFAWETPFAKLVNFSRRKEMDTIWRMAMLKCWNTVIFNIWSRSILLLTIAVYVLVIDGDLTPAKVFVCMSAIENLKTGLMHGIPLSVVHTSECLISLKRIEDFLLLEEMQQTLPLEVGNVRPEINECGIWMKNVSASWNKNGEAVLYNINLTVNPGDLLVIVGPVGCGKTSVLMSILGEIPINSGDVKVRGKLSYASQVPWIFNGSVRENIIFGSEFDETKYMEVLHACALDKDISQFPYGDETAVGEKGISLSGGQKARINLARALYFDSDIYLLDDPLSAVDSSVSKHLFEKCVNGYLMEKVCILVTHQIQSLKNASQILVLKEGRCVAVGTYEQLMESVEDLAALMGHYEPKPPRSRHFSIASTTSTTSIEELVNCPALLKVHDRQFSVCSASNIHIRDKETIEKPASDNIPKSNKEIKIDGDIKLSTYKAFIDYGSGAFLVCAMFAFGFGFQGLYVGTDFWLMRWTNLVQNKYNVKDCWSDTNKTFLNKTIFYNDTYGVTDPDIFQQFIGNVSDRCFLLTRNFLYDEFDADQQIDTKYNLSVYAGFLLVLFLSGSVRTYLSFFICIKGSITLYNKMFQSILRSPIQFFHDNPVGRVLNRFSKDVGALDEILPLSVSDSILISIIVIGVICTVAIVEPWFLIPTAIMIGIFVLSRNIFWPTVLDLKRFDGIVRSPVYSHLITSLCGLTTIRAFKARQPFEMHFDDYQDQHSSVWFLYFASIRWASIYLECISSFYLICVTIAITFLSGEPSLASKAGLAIASALHLRGCLQYSLRQLFEVASHMTSVERLVEYSNLTPEASLETEKSKAPPSNWPSEGHIKYENVTLRYDEDDPPVLKNLNFEISSEEKIGIVGRTGAGKSSIIATLFRMTEPEGNIIVDGICTKDLGLHDLRKKISIIPQDPVLFNGTVRRNLDPFSEYRDDELWQVLEEVYMKEEIIDMPYGLSTELSEGGVNFSVGQRQLVCLARAILRRNRILVLDEATANVDPNTDQLIQKTIRNCFSHCTVLTIAHRLNTIMDSDRIMVLDAGEIKEFDEPYTLLCDPDGLFTHMVKTTGHLMAKKLRDMAFAAHTKKSTRMQNATNAFGGIRDGGGEVIDVHVENEAREDVEYDVKNNAVMGCINEAYEYTEVTHL